MSLTAKRQMSKGLSSLADPGNSQRRSCSPALCQNTHVSYFCRIYDNTRAGTLWVAALWFQQVLDAFDLVLQPGIQSERGGSSEGWHCLEIADGREWICWQDLRVTAVNRSLPGWPSNWFHFLHNTFFKYVFVFWQVQELNNYRSKCSLLFHYDWISIPLVYTQVKE